MAQTYVEDLYDDTIAMFTIMADLELNMLALKSNFSGTSAPSSGGGFLAVLEEGVFWGDETKKLLKMYTGSEWVGIMYGDESSEIYVYRNGVLDGWVVDETSGIEDCIIGFASSTSGDEWDVAEGEIAGDWDVALGENHIHQIYRSGQPGSDDTVFNPYDTVEEQGLEITLCTLIGFDWCSISDGVNGYLPDPPYNHEHDHLNTNKSMGDIYTERTGIGTWRPKAAVGTLQYMDLNS